jgi:phage terminase large subunit
MLITYAVQNPRVEISIVAESIPHLRRGAIRDFLKILQMVGMYKEQNWNKSSLTYTFSNEAFIEFFSAQINPTNYEVQGVTFYS